jgi:hypothetical protein
MDDRTAKSIAASLERIEKNTLPAGPESMEKAPINTGFDRFEEDGKGYRQG